MDFEETELWSSIRKQVSAIAKSFPPEYWRKKDKTKEFPRELWDELAKGGWFGTTVSQDYGGAGLGISELSVVIHEVARSGGGVMGGNLFTVTSAMAPFAIQANSPPSVKEKYLPNIASGKLVCSIGITEPTAGVNTLDVKTFAEKKSGEYLITGQKVWITFSPVANLILLVTRTTKKEEAKSKTDGLTLFLVEMKNPRVRVATIEGLAMRPLLSSEVFFEGVSVPEENMIGEEGKGWKALTAVLNSERIASSSLCVGTGDLVLEKAVAYARQRIVFDRPIGQNQGVQFPLADSKARIDGIKPMVTKAAWLYDKGRDCAFEANVAAYLSAQAAFEAADRAIQTLGGMGFAAEQDIERHWRDLRLWRTAPVPEQMVLSFVGSHVLGLPRSY